MPTASQRSKAENLARIRRNQQNCRERKRNHVAELERQVRELGEQIQRCQPCPPPPARLRGSQLDAVLEENAALRRLLSAMGVDEHSQQQYLQSSVKRDAVMSILDHDAQAPILSRSSRHTSPPSPTATHQAFSPIDGSLSIQNGSLTAGIAWPDSNIGASISIPSNFDASVSTLFGSEVNGSGVSTNFDSFPVLNMPISDFESHRSNGTTRPSSAFASEWQFRIPSPSNNLTTPCCLEADSLPTPSASETSTVCSIALSMVFQNNKKRLPATELNERLRSGFRKDPAVPRECRVENRVLFRVLAEIST